MRVKLKKNYNFAGTACEYEFDLVLNQINLSIKGCIYIQFPYRIPAKINR